LIQVAEARHARLQALAAGTAPAAQTIVVAVSPPSTATPLTTVAPMAPPPPERTTPPPAPTQVAEVVAPAHLPQAKPMIHAKADETQEVTQPAPVDVPPSASPRLVIRFVPHGGWKACGSLGRNSKACVPVEDLS
jgi:hypothetical protein